MLSLHTERIEGQETKTRGTRKVKELKEDKLTMRKGHTNEKFSGQDGVYVEKIGRGKETDWASDK